MRRSTLVLILALACLPAAVGAGEPPTPEEAAAAEIGRGLLSPITATRRAAEVRLLARLRKGGDLEAFVRAMSDGVAAWANRNERLMEVWLHQAVHGTAEERDQAVRLLAALGPPAVRRLSLELRHHLQHGTPSAVPPVGEAPAPAAPRAFVPVPPPRTTNDLPPSPLEPGMPRIYDLKDLVAGGMNPVQVRSLLQKAANARQVRMYGAHYVVTATEKGHAALLEHLRTLHSPQAEVGGESRNEPAGQTEDAQPARPSPPPPDAPVPEVGAKHGESALGDSAVAAIWHVEPVFVHLPASATLDGLWKAASRTQTAPDVLGRAHVTVGNYSEIARWSQMARRVPDARSETPVPHPSVVRLGGKAIVFSGKELRYSKDVRRTKGGAWSLVTGSIRHGIGVDVSLAATGRGLHVDVSATLTEVGLPMPVHRIKPAPDAASVELERPEWSTTRARAAFDLPPDGGGAFLALEGFGTPKDEKVVLVLTIRPQPDPALNPRAARSPK